MCFEVTYALPEDVAKGDAVDGVKLIATSEE